MLKLFHLVLILFIIIFLIMIQIIYSQLKSNVLIANFFIINLMNLIFLNLIHSCFILITITSFILSIVVLLFGYVIKLFLNQHQLEFTLNY